MRTYGNVGSGTNAGAPPDLIDYLRARLDEEEAIARAATPGPWYPKTDDDQRYGEFGWTFGVVEYTTDWFVAEASDGEQGKANAIYVGTFDPPRMLADIAAKRAVLDEHEAEKPWFKGEVYCLSCDRLDYPCRTLLALSQPYADRDDFDPAWRMP